ncbi:MAG: EAL domain-containing protein [Sedimenticola sp.]|nr:EAL domain-containing protein [Sedimenticola sp.]
MRFRDRVVVHICRMLLPILLIATPLANGADGPRMVRIGLYQNPPKIFHDEKGAAYGIFPQLLQHLAGYGGWEPRYVTCEWHRCLQLLESGGIDLLPDVAISEARQERFDFHPTPALYSWSQVYRRPGIEINSLQDLEGKRIALLKNSIQATQFLNITRGIGLQGHPLTTDSFDQAFALVQAGEADAVIANHFFGGYRAADFGLLETPIIIQPSRLFIASAKGRNGGLLRSIESALSEWQADPGSPYYQTLKAWDQRIPEALVPRSVRLGLLIAVALLLLTGVITLLLRRRLAARTAHLVETRNRLQATLDAMPDLLFELDAEGRYLDCHSPRGDPLAIRPGKFLGRTVHQMLPAGAASTIMEGLAEAKRNGHAGEKEIELDFRDGTHWFDLSISRLDQGPGPERFVMLAHDITTRRQDKARIERLTRFYEALSQCNQAILHGSDERQLFSRICHDAVIYGGLEMAWIGLLDETSGTIRPAASHGNGTGYLDGLLISTDADHPNGQGPTGTCVRENRPVWSQDFRNDPGTRPWQERARQHGWGSSAAIPLHRKGQVIGAFMLYSGEQEAFDPEVKNLLLEMALDISFALDQFALRKAHEQALEELRESEARYRLAFKTSPDAVNINRLEDGTYLDVNAGFERITGWKGDEVIGRSSAEINIWNNPADREKLVEALRSRGMCENLEAEFRMKSGEIRTGMMSANVIQLKGEPCILSITRDTTELKQAGEQLRKLSVAVDQSPVSIVITDLDARIEYVNNTFLRYTGYSRDEVIGRNPRILKSGNTPDETYREMWEQLTRDEEWRGVLHNRRKDGSEFVESTLIYPVHQADGSTTHYLAIKEDISAKLDAEQRIHDLAYFDQLTGLANRRLLQERLDFTLSMAQRHDESLALLLLDLDNFKRINDSLGHSYGDQVLVEVAQRITLSVREEDTVARMGGDEFVILLAGADEHAAARIASKLITTVSAPCTLDGHQMMITPSIGISLYPHDGEDMETLLQNADTAMYRVKQSSHNDFRFFTQEMQSHSARKLYLANALRYAIEQGQLELHYQPQVSLTDGRIVGAEALLRWTHPEFGAVSPAEFIPIAEESGQIIAIGEWVLRSAAHQLSLWLKNSLPPLTLAVNVSAAQFRHSGLQNMVVNALDEAGVEHRHIELELTEAVAMSDPGEVVAIMDSLHAQGILMSIDDFGTGYSSLSYLKRFNISKLKIDQSFVQDIPHDSGDMAIVGTIINMAHSLGIDTLAEGVETEEQLAFLRAQGCNQAQGYLFSRPLPAADFEALLESRHEYRVTA